MKKTENQFENNAKNIKNNAKNIKNSKTVNGKKICENNQNEYTKLQKFCVDRLTEIANKLDSFGENIANNVNNLENQSENTQNQSENTQNQSEISQNLSEITENVEKLSKKTENLYEKVGFTKNLFEKNENLCEKVENSSIYVGKELEDGRKIAKILDTDDETQKTIIYYCGNDENEFKELCSMPDSYFGDKKSDDKLFEQYSSHFPKRVKKTEYLVSTETKRKYKKIGNCEKKYRTNADRLADLQMYDLTKWVELILTIHPYLPSIADFIEKTIDKISISAYSCAHLFGGTEACMNDISEMIDNKIAVINLFLIGNKLKNLLSDEELKIVDCTINRHSKISEIAKQGQYRNVYLKRDKILKRLTAYLKVNDFTPESLISDYGKLNIVLYYA